MTSFVADYTVSKFSALELRRTRSSMQLHTPGHQNACMLLQALLKPSLEHDNQPPPGYPSQSLGNDNPNAQQPLPQRTDRPQHKDAARNKAKKDKVLPKGIQENPTLQLRPLNRSLGPAQATEGATQNDPALPSTSRGWRSSMASRGLQKAGSMKARTSASQREETMSEKQVRMDAAGTTLAPSTIERLERQGFLPSLLSRAQNLSSRRHSLRQGSSNGRLRRRPLRTSRSQGSHSPSSRASRGSHEGPSSPSMDSRNHSH